MLSDFESSVDNQIKYAVNKEIEKRKISHVKNINEVSDTRGKSEVLKNGINNLHQVKKTLDKIFLLFFEESFL